MQNEKQIKKLKRQIELYEAKGYTDTAAHVMLERLQQQPAAGATPQKRQKVKQEERDGKSDL